MAVKWSGGSGGASGATADELARIDSLEKNLGVNFLRDSIAEGWSIFEMVDGFADVYTDETGVNTGASTNQVYNTAGDYYSPQTGSSHSLLIQSETTNGSTTFTDSTGVHTITGNGGISHSTTQAKFGSSSVQFDGIDDYLSVPDNTDFDLDGTASFTIECQIYPTSLASAQDICTKWDTGQQAYIIRLTTGGEIELYFNGSLFLTSSSAGISINNWYHVAVVRNDSDSTTKIYINGTERASTLSTPVIPNTTSALAWGAVNVGSGPVLHFSGFMEEMSVLKGIARAPESGGPSSPYSISTTEMTLIGATQTANSAPTSARMVILHDPIDSVTLNTDAILDISMDGGSTYSTAFTLTKEADYDANVEILTTNDLLLDSTSGTSIVYRFRTANSKDQRLHGVYVQWR